MGWISRACGESTMIKNLTGGPGVIVNGGNNVSPYINQNINNPMQGMIRLNGSDFQVFDGTGWQQLATAYPSVSLDGETQDLLQWARTQRQLDLNRKTLIENNPALEKAYEAIQRAEANFDILAKFVENDLDAELRELAP
jgi:hypothetical protein